jgi:hypothetical protein
MKWPKAREAEDGVKVSKKAKVESTTTFLCYECCTSLMVPKFQQEKSIAKHVHITL